MVINDAGVQTLTNTGNRREIDQTAGLSEGCAPTEETVLLKGVDKLQSNWHSV